MKDKLEPNMYVRLNCNYELGIGKTIGEIDEDNFIKTKVKDGFECSLPTYMIKKASHNIVDLLEVGDYLNGFKVSKIERYDTKTIIKIGNSTFNVLEGEEIYTPSYDNNNGYEKLEKLKSIVTKEQFENISYEVK